MKIFKLSVLFLLGLFISVPPELLFAQENVPAWKMTYSYDLRRKINGQYRGLFYGYQSGSWTTSRNPEGSLDVKAHYLIAEDSIRNNSMAEKPLSTEKDVSFVINKQGRMESVTSQDIPYYRNYPEEPPKDIKIGEHWVGSGSISVDPKNSGKFTVIPILVDYIYKGPADWNGRSSILITAKYAVRYQSGLDRSGDADLLKAEGTHDAWIYLDPESNMPFFLRETTKEMFQYQDSTKIEDEGIRFTFFEGFTPFMPQEKAQEVGQKLKDSGITDVDVSADPRGVKLTLQNLKFVADQSILLPGEENRLNKIVEALQQIPDKTLLVTGHTADVGSQESQQELSVNRAKVIVEELKKRGIEGKRLFYAGKAGREPVAENTTETGRMQNRRVEIIVMND